MQKLNIFQFVIGFKGLFEVSPEDISSILMTGGLFILLKNPSQMQHGYKKHISKKSFFNYSTALIKLSTWL